MASTILDAATAQRRHPEQVADVLKRLKEIDANAVGWSYDMAERIDGLQRNPCLKGVNRLVENPSHYLICLTGCREHKRVQAKLDLTQLVHGPADSLPRELFEMTKPAGVSAYLWQPRRPESPGWNEAVITEAFEHRETGQRVFVAVDDSGARRFLQNERGGSWKTLGNWRRSKAFKPMKPDAIVTAIGALDSGRVPAGPASVADLLQALGMGATAIAREHQQMDTEPSAPTAGGRQWAWGEQLPATDAAPYVALIIGQVGPKSGNALEVLGALAHPGNALMARVAKVLLDEIAVGRPSDQAIQNALARARHEGSPLPPFEDGADLVAFLQTCAASAKHQPPMRPVFLR